MFSFRIETSTEHNNVRFTALLTKRNFLFGNSNRRAYNGKMIHKFQNHFKTLTFYLYNLRGIRNFLIKKTLPRVCRVRVRVFNKTIYPLIIKHWILSFNN